jgi:hypothetical protein
MLRNCIITSLFFCRCPNASSYATLYCKCCRDASKIRDVNDVSTMENGLSCRRHGIGIPAPGSVRYCWSRIIPALPSYDFYPLFFSYVMNRHKADYLPTSLMSEKESYFFMLLQINWMRSAKVTELHYTFWTGKICLHRCENILHCQFLLIFRSPMNKKWWILWWCEEGRAQAATCMPPTGSIRRNFRHSGFSKVRYVRSNQHDRYSYR